MKSKLKSALFSILILISFAGCKDTSYDRNKPDSLTDDVESLSKLAPSVAIARILLLPLILVGTGIILNGIVLVRVRSRSKTEVERQYAEEEEAE